MLSWELVPKENTDWNQFVHNSPYGDVLQMWQWGSIKETEGWSLHRIGVIKGAKKLMYSMILTKPVKGLGVYAYCPHGPIWNELSDLEKGMETWMEGIRSLASEHNWFTLDIEPKLYEMCDATEKEKLPNTVPYTSWLSKDAQSIFQKYGFSKTGRNMQPKYKLITNLTQSEDDILKGMKKNTRYNVKYAQKKGAVIRETHPGDDKAETELDGLYAMLLETQKRAGGYPVRPRKMFSKLIEVFAGTPYVSIFTGSVAGDDIITNITFKTKYWSSSFYAGSNRLHSKVRTPYLLRWASLQACKAYGSATYDFWGIVPSKNHAGYSENKLSFGGVRLNSCGLWSYSFNWKSKLWPLLLKVRRSLADIKRMVKR